MANQFGFCSIKEAWDANEGEMNNNAGYTYTLDPSTGGYKPRDTPIIQDHDGIYGRLQHTRQIQDKQTQLYNESYTNPNITPQYEKLNNANSTPNMNQVPVLYRPYKETSSANQRGYVDSQLTNANCLRFLNFMHKCDDKTFQEIMNDYEEFCRFREFKRNENNFFGNEALNNPSNAPIPSIDKAGSNLIENFGLKTEHLQNLSDQLLDNDLIIVIILGVILIFILDLVSKIAKRF